MRAHSISPILQHFNKSPKSVMASAHKSRPSMPSTDAIAPNAEQLFVYPSVRASATDPATSDWTVEVTTPLSTPVLSPSMATMQTPFQQSMQLSMDLFVGQHAQAVLEQPWTPGHKASDSVVSLRIQQAILVAPRAGTGDDKAVEPVEAFSETALRSPLNAAAKPGYHAASPNIEDGLARQTAVTEPITTVEQAPEHSKPNKVAEEPSVHELFLHKSSPPQRLRRPGWERQRHTLDQPGGPVCHLPRDLPTTWLYFDPAHQNSPRRFLPAATTHPGLWWVSQLEREYMYMHMQSESHLGDPRIRPGSPSMGSGQAAPMDLSKEFVSLNDLSPNEHLLLYWHVDSDQDWSIQVSARRRFARKSGRSGTDFDQDRFATGHARLSACICNGPQGGACAGCGLSKGSQACATGSHAGAGALPGRTCERCCGRKGPFARRHLLSGSQAYTWARPFKTLQRLLQCVSAQVQLILLEGLAVHAVSLAHDQHGHRVRISFNTGRVMMC